MFRSLRTRRLTGGLDLGAVTVIGMLEEIGAGHAPTPCSIKVESPLRAVGLSLTVGLF